MSGKCIKADQCFTCVGNTKLTKITDDNDFYVGHFRLIIDAFFGGNNTAQIRMLGSESSTLCGIEELKSPAEMRTEPIIEFHNSSPIHGRLENV